MPRIHILGAAGAGTTTLARALAGRLRVPWFDSDDYYWIPTIPPFRIKRPPAERDRRLRGDLAAYDDWVWSGSATSWDVDAHERITLCVYLTLPRELRLARLRAREEQTHGDLPYVTREEIDEEIRAFLEWAARYEDGGLDVRSRALHERWLGGLACPVLRLNGDLSNETRVERVLAALA